MPPGVDVLVGIASALTALGVIWLTVRRIARLLRRVSDFFDDWEGTEERPGVPARSGVMQRLAVIEGEVRNNGGESLKDAVHRTEAAVGVLGQRMDGVEAEVRKTVPPVVVNVPTALNQQHMEES